MGGGKLFNIILEYNQNIHINNMATSRTFNVLVAEDDAF